MVWGEAIGKHSKDYGVINYFKAIDEFGDLMGQLECWKEAECKFPRVGPVLQHLLLSPLLPERSLFWGGEPTNREKYDLTKDSN
jgi:hypothetical protein